MSAKEVAAERNRLDTEEKRLADWIEEIRANDPAIQYEKHRQAMNVLIHDRTELQRAESRLLSALGPAPECAALVDEVKRLMAEERQIKSLCGGIPTKCTLPGALAKLQKERDDAEKSIAEIDASCNKPHLIMSLGTKMRRRDLGEIIKAWPQMKAFCEAGEKIAAIKARLKAIGEEQTALTKRQREKSLAVA
jgi:uncharacterized protein with HEPN domain